MSITFCAAEELSVARPFSDHAVLQRDKPLPIWGKGTPGAKVSVVFQNQTKETLADAAGVWRVTLDALPANAEPQGMVVSANGEVIRVRDLLVGDVWLCSGQSNMGFNLSRSESGPADIPLANYPSIRALSVPQTPSATPADSARVTWQVCEPERIGGVSAVAFYFARELHKELGVPIGIIVSSWGGTQIESWMSDAALKADANYQAILARWQKVVEGVPEEMRRHEVRLERERVAKAKAEAEGVPYTGKPPREPEGLVSRWTPSGLYNGMIHPFVPMALRGIIWYQGETNAGRASEYRTLFPAMISQWRQDFKQADLPFYFVQIANWRRKGDDWSVAYLREAQMAALALPKTGMAVTIDVGNPDDVHPLNKLDVGKRLAYVALAKTYDKKIPFSGPLYREAKAEGGKMRVLFDHADKLSLKVQEPSGFTVAGDDQVFHSAVATLEGEAVLVSAAEVPKPVAVRYAFENAPPSTLTNSACLPAVPFRSDKWPQPPDPAPEPTPASRPSAERESQAN